MEKQFNLSEKLDKDIQILCLLARDPDDKNAEKFIKATENIEEDVKDFIRLLKEDTGCEPINSREKQIIALFKERIDKLAGDKLTKKED